MNIKIPKLSLVVLIGPSGSGKSTFARKHFLPTEVISSDACRAMVSDDENDQPSCSAIRASTDFALARVWLGRAPSVCSTWANDAAVGFGRKRHRLLPRNFHHRRMLAFGSVF